AGFVFDVVGDFDSLIASLASGQLRFGIHLQNMWGGASDSYVNSVTPVPLPAAGILLIGALGGLGFASRRKKRLAA
ncbi:VPLPA-CTERM protein sorting domain-containing protein, partial [Salipiger thiooxidans]